MFAVVLVGGFGTRLRPLTYDVPKPILPIVRRPMIERLVERLANSGVTDVVLALGFQPEPFHDAFPDQRFGETRIHYVVEPEPLDTAGAIAFAARAAGVDDTFLALNGDIISDLDIGAFVSTHRSHGGAGTLHLTPVDDPCAFGVVELNGGRINRFVEKPQPGETDSTLINAGAYVLEPSVLDLIAENVRVSIERDVFPSLVSSGELYGFPTTGYWIDAGRPELYLAANLDLIDGAAGHAAEPIDANSSIAATARVTRSVVDRDVTISDRAVVTDSVLLPGATVGDGAVLTRTIVDGTIGAGCQLVDVVVGRKTEVPAGTNLANERIPSPE